MPSVDANTIALWLLDEENASDNAVDQTGNYTLTAINSPPAHPGPARWVGTNHLTGNTSQFQIAMPSAIRDVLTSDAWTWEGWVKRYPGGGSGTSYVFAASATGETSVTNYLAGIFISSSGIGMFWESGSGTDRSWNSLVVPPFFEWFHLALCWNPDDSITLFVNGELVATSSTGLVRATGGENTTIRMSRDFTSNIGCQALSRVRLSNIVRTPTEILASFDEGAPADGAPQDATPPVVSNISPAPGVLPGTLSTARFTALEFDVVDAAPGLRTVVVHVRVRDPRRPRTLVVHDGTSFLPPFATLSTRTGDAGAGYHYTVLPDLGWWGDIESLRVFAVDEAGNLHS